MQEILIISNYYPPEKGAAANRIEELALQLTENNYQISVICPLANYPKGEIFPEYKGKIYVNENLENISVKRLWIYPSVSKNIFVRLLSVLSFSTSLFFYLLFSKIPHKVIIQSPPLLLSFISVLVLWFKRKKIILNVSDLWPLAAIELNALKKGSISHKASLVMEKFIYKNSSLILGQSNEIITHVLSLYPNKKCYLYRNFPNHKVDKIDFNIQENEPIKIFYAGLLGVAQGIFELCQNIKIENLNVELHIFGDGADKIKIQELIFAKKNSQIFFHGMLERIELHTQLKTMDIAIVPLKTRIYGSVPSKIFEYSALGFPILYCGGGEGSEIVQENNLGWVAEVGNYASLNDNILEISKLSKQSLFIKKEKVFNKSKTEFNLKNQMESLMEKNIF
ncbi:MAG: glycosyltransferase family 4 protein [Flavobacterium sp.]|nr:glycosyltransferase family 4 protein [Flavobacterium sp.]